MREYAFDCIGSSVDEEDKVGYLVTWDGYTPQDDRVEPPGNILEHFITHYWRRMKHIDAVDNDVNEHKSSKKGRYRSSRYVLKTAMFKTKFQIIANDWVGCTTVPQKKLRQIDDLELFVQ